MYYFQGKNENFHKLLEITYNRYQEVKSTPLQLRKGFEHFVEFIPGEYASDSSTDCFPDPDGKFVGSAFQLAAMGLLLPGVTPVCGMSGFCFGITEEGISLFENKERLNREFPVAQKNIAFVIMSFSDNRDLKDAYNCAIKRAIEEAGYPCIRVDEIEHNRRITDKVLEFITTARFIVADLTEQRPNCYYEIGFAHAKNIEVIPIIKDGDTIHFDLKDYNFIIYPNLSELKDRLLKRIIETVGKCPA